MDAQRVPPAAVAEQAKAPPQRRVPSRPARRTSSPGVLQVQTTPEHVSRDRPSAPAASRGRADTRALLRRGYGALRTAGLSDTEAQAILAPFRELARRQAAPQTQQRESDYMSFLRHAEYELRHGNSAGLWTTADVIARAKELARCFPSISRAHRKSSARGILWTVLRSEDYQRW